MFPKDLHFPEGVFKQKSMQEYLIAKEKAVKEGRVEQHWVDRVDATIGITEKIGKLYFPCARKNDFDYRGFTVADKMSHKFCVDLFEYYWSCARSNSQSARLFFGTKENALIFLFCKILKVLCCEIWLSQQRV